MGVEHLHKSRYDNINDEFYTKYEDVASELMNYDFEGKRVFCPCDTEDSAFVQYFKTYFRYLRLRLLSYTYLGAGGIYNYNGIKTTFIATDCDSCRDASLLGSYDIIVTNPPFSIFKDIYMTWKSANENRGWLDFLFIAPLHKLSLKEVFKDIMEEKVKLGYTKVDEFLTPDGGSKKFGNIYWLTSLPVKNNMPHKYLFGSGEKQKFINMDCAFIKSVADIDYNYLEPMAVPLTFLYGFPYDDFQILGTTSGSSWNDISDIKTTPVHGIKVYETQKPIEKLADKVFLADTEGKYDINGVRAKIPFQRLVIQRW